MPASAFLIYALGIVAIVALIAILVDRKERQR